MRCLRPEWEPDNFSCSHRCTSYVRPWSGARLVLITPARPAYLLRFLRFFLLLPLPQKWAALCFLSLAKSSSGQSRTRIPPRV
jgi:hypothetical protein